MKQRGRVNAGLQVVVPIRVLDAGGAPSATDATLDTGFTGFLALPSHAIARLGLKFDSMSTARLANGSVVSLRRFEARVHWLGTERDVFVVEANGGPLIGMSLLTGCDVRFRAQEGGDVEISLIQTPHT